MRLLDRTNRYKTTAQLWLTILLLVSGCSMFPGDEVENVSKSAEVLYTEGVQSLRKNHFQDATKRFQELDRKHPFSPWATRAQTNLIYTQYKLEEYADAIGAAERFIRLHPRNRHVAYAYYMRGLSFYQQISSATHDQNNTREAYNAFQELMRRFPKSDYAWEAKQMLILCRDRLAEQEVVVARYYLDQEEYIAAMHRFSHLLKNPLYKTTPYLEEALFSMVLITHHLGMNQDARSHAAVLGHNFPDGPFYQHALQILEKNADTTHWQLADMRQGIQQQSVVSRFFQGLAPTIFPNQTQIDQ